MAAHVMSVEPDRNTVGAISKQAGLSESVSAGLKLVGIDDESDQVK